jgi:hypothetical protein
LCAGDRNFFRLLIKMCTVVVQRIQALGLDQWYLASYMLDEAGWSTDSFIHAQVEWENFSIGEIESYVVVEQDYCSVIEQLG